MLFFAFSLLVSKAVADNNLTDALLFTPLSSVTIEDVFGLGDQSYRTCVVVFGRTSHPLWFTIVAPVMSTLLLSLLPALVPLLCKRLKKKGCCCWSNDDKADAESEPGAFTKETPKNTVVPISDSPPPPAIPKCLRCTIRTSRAACADCNTQGLVVLCERCDTEIHFPSVADGLHLEQTGPPQSVFDPPHRRFLLPVVKPEHEIDCNRCRKAPSVATCRQCDPIALLCEACDLVVHRRSSSDGPPEHKTTLTVATDSVLEAESLMGKVVQEMMETLYLPVVLPTLLLALVQACLVIYKVSGADSAQRWSAYQSFVVELSDSNLTFLYIFTFIRGSLAARNSFAGMRCVGCLSSPRCRGFWIEALLGTMIALLLVVIPLLLTHVLPGLIAYFWIWLPGLAIPFVLRSLSRKCKPGHNPQKSRHSPSSFLSMLVFSVVGLSLALQLSVRYMAIIYALGRDQYISVIQDDWQRRDSICYYSGLYVQNSGALLGLVTRLGF